MARADRQPKASSSKAPYSKESSSSSSRTVKNARRPRKGTLTSDSPTTQPGVQKLKSALRQTRRLLAKEGLAADARVVAERKLKAQEADLAKALLSRTERTMAVRYHKVRFFERQKVVRKMNQTARALAAEDTPKPELKALKKTLKDLRIDLNYILHYPKTRKYISLFPPSARGASDSLVDEAEQVKTDAEREELRNEIRARMEAGELPVEPEKSLDAGAQRGVGAEDGESDVGEGDVDMDVDEELPVAAPAIDMRMARAKAKAKAKKTKSARISETKEEKAKPPTLASDAFFDEDD